MFEISYHIAILLHVFAVVVWIGGMFFAHLILRPAAIALPPDLRLPLWGRVLNGFFPWVWAAILLILMTGYGIIFVIFGGLHNIKPHLHVMMGFGDLMAFLFFYIWFFPYRMLKSALAAGDISSASRHQARIRYIITINLLLGILTLSVAVLGRYQ